MEKVVLGIVAHVDSGKTTLTEAILFNSGVINKIGRVDHRDSFLDTDKIERERGITVFSKLARFDLGRKAATLVDTPGHVDFSSETERSFSVLDYAILVISGSEGVQSHTESLWKLLREHGIPTFIFVNKMDLSEKSEDEILAELKAKLSDGIVNLNSDAANEEISLTDEGVLESYLETGEIAHEDVVRLIGEDKIYPVYFGSALKNQGVAEFLEALEEYTKGNDSSAYKADDELQATIYKIARDPKGQRMTFVKINKGRLKVKDSLNGVNRNGENWEEKVNEIRFYSGERFESRSEAGPGDVCALTGLTKTMAGDYIGKAWNNKGPTFVPVLSYCVNVLSGENISQVLNCFKILEEEEPNLFVSWDESLKQINVRLMGQVQLEIVKELVKDRFGIIVEFGNENIIYKETIEKTVIGVGHFEPLRHYSEVQLLLEPLEPGSGLVIKNNCKDEDLDRNWQNLILTHLGERVHIGPLMGCELTDIKITLVNGRAHKKHTMGGDFREATFRALRQGLLQCQGVLLEPWYDFKLTLPNENLGRAMSDIKRLGGSFEPVEEIAEMVTIEGSGPVASFRDYQLQVNSYTKGRGRLAISNGGYHRCKNEDEVLANSYYDGENDPYNTGDSVFCANGAGFNVKWYEVFDYMHLPNYLEEKEKHERQVQGNVLSYGNSLADDSELLAIFERTYGKVKRKNNLEKKLIASEEYLKNPEKIRKNSAAPLREYLLIDGYNLIHQWDELKELSKVSFGAARDKLVDIICNYAGIKNCTVIIVFDAYKVKDNPGRVEKIHNLYVVYTKERETADVFIEKVTYQVEEKRRVRVVTSDNLEQMIITGHGALKTSSKAFVEEVKEVEEKIRELLL